MLTKEEILAVPVPISTTTYKAVPHQILFDELYENLDRLNLKVASESYRTDQNGQKLIAKLRIDRGDNEKSFMIAFRNSYDKSMSVGFGVGAEVHICSNGMISAEHSLRQKHQGTVLSGLRQIMAKSINGLEEVYRAFEKESHIMKGIELNRRLEAELIGRMFIEQGLITATQVGIINSQLNKPDHIEFADPTLWSLYNHTTEALKTSHSSRMIQDHIAINTFFKTEFNYN